MAIGGVDLGRVMSGVQDLVKERQNEITRPDLNQINNQNRFEQNLDEKLRNVHERDNADNNPRKFDAKEKGSNEYAGDGGKNRNKNREGQSEGKVVSKSAFGFDMKI